MRDHRSTNYSIIFFHHRLSTSNQYKSISYIQLVNPPLSIAADCVKFGSCSLESDKFLTVCEKGQVAIVDLKNGGSITRQQMSAEAAIMNPLSKVLALRCTYLTGFYNGACDSRRYVSIQRPVLKF